METNKMTIKEYASKIYSKIGNATSSKDVEKIINDALSNLKKQNISDIGIEQFKEYLRSQSSIIKEAQENDQTLKNQRKAMKLLKKGS